MSATVKPSRLSGTLKTGILHFGLGAFHRAHQAVAIEDAMTASGGDWGIEAVAMRNGDMARVMNEQGCVYTLIEQHADGPRFRQISAIRKAWSLPDQATEIAERFTDPAINIITVTVTEKGYCADLAKRRLDVPHPGIQADLTNADTPKTLLGILALGLSERRKANGTGLTIISCDNLSDNGNLLRGVLLEFVALGDPALASWIEAECTFPNTMVDRITPAASEATFALAETALGKPDPMAIETEPFSRWIIEDKFAGPQPDWQAAGVMVVADVAPYEKMKLRMLNGAHSLIAYAGTVHGLIDVRDVMAQPHWHDIVQRHMLAAAETLIPLSGFSFNDYADDLIERFSNPAIEHRCIQIASDGSQKLPQRIFAPALERLDNGLPIETFALATALWIKHIEMADKDGLADPMAAELAALVDANINNQQSLFTQLAKLDGLAMRSIFERTDWTDAVSNALNSLRG